MRLENSRFSKDINHQSIISSQFSSEAVPLLRRHGASAYAAARGLHTDRGGPLRGDATERPGPVGRVDAGRGDESPWAAAADGAAREDRDARGKTGACDRCVDATHAQVTCRQDLLGTVDAHRIRAVDDL